MERTVDTHRESRSESKHETAQERRTRQQKDRVECIAKKIGATPQKTQRFLKEKERLERRGITQQMSFEEMRGQLRPGVIREIEGRPVRFAPGSITMRCTMVEPGLFPVSGTGFRSIAGVVWGMEKGELDAEEAIEVAVGIAKEVAEERMEALSKEVEAPGGRTEKTDEHGSAAEKTDAERFWVSHLSSYAGPQSVSNRLLTGPEERREKITEAYIPTYEKAVRVKPLPEDHPNAEYINGGIEKAKECLRILNAAHAGGLFSGGEDLTPAIESASSSVRHAYGEAPTLDIITESTIRLDLRIELGVEVLTTEEHLDLLARRLWVCGF